MNIVHSFAAVALREFRRIGTRKSLSMLMIGLPILLFTLMALIYVKGIVREVPVAIVDDDHSEVSRTLVRYIEGASSMRIEVYAPSLEAAKSAMQAGRVQGIFVIPQGLEQNVKIGKQGTVLLLKNTLNLIYGNTLMRDGSTIIRTVSAGVLMKKLQSSGMMPQQAMNAVMPIRLQTQALFNPNYSYLDFLVPGLLPSLLQMIIFVTGVLVISSEFGHGTFRELMEAGGGRVLPILFGKLVPHVAVHSATAFATVGILFPIFGIPVRGSILLIMALFVLFIAAAQSMALALSSLLHDQQRATEFGLFYSTPAFMFSGFTYPLWAMPAADVWWARLMPSTHFLGAFIKVRHMGAPAEFVGGEMLALGAFIGVGCAIAAAGLSCNMKKAVRVPAGEEAA